MYKKGDKALAFHGPLLYEAKILDTRDAKDASGAVTGGTQFFVHYRGWKDTWDEWVEADRLLELNEENVKTQKELREAALASQRQASTASTTSGKRSAGGKDASSKEDGASAASAAHGGSTRGQKRTRESGAAAAAAAAAAMADVDREDEHYRKAEIRLDMPDALKSQLVDDWENVTKNEQLVAPLPRKPSVAEIIEDYSRAERRRINGGAEGEIFDEIMAGLKIYFDRCFGTLLLYRFERQQYLEVKKKKEFAGKEMSEIFGAEHLLRLFVSLPELVAHTNMDPQSVHVLCQHLERFLQYMVKHQDTLFLKAYENASPNYQSLVRGA